MILRYIFFHIASVPVKLEGKFLLPANLELQMIPPNAFVGGLAKCAPIEKVI